MRIVQVGCMGRGQVWVKAVRACRELEPVGYVDIVEEHLERLQQEYGVPQAQCYTDLVSALRESRPEAVLIVTPPSVHMAQALQAFGAGCHVLTEKPLADTLENCNRMVSAAEESGKILVVAQNYRYKRPVRTLFQALRRHVCGRPGEVSIRFFRDPHFGGFREEMSQPLIVDMAIHHFDLMRYLLEADPIRMLARTWNPEWSWFAGDASASCMIDMRPHVRPDTVIPVTYSGSWCAPGSVTSWNGDWRIQCEHGTITMIDDRIFVHRENESEPEELPLIEEATSEEEQLLQDFYRSVRGGGEPKTSGRDNLNTIKMVFAAIESSERGRAISWEQ